jgi:hypothetical protein
LRLSLRRPLTAASNELRHRTAARRVFIAVSGWLFFEGDVEDEKDLRSSQGFGRTS